MKISRCAHLADAVLRPTEAVARPRGAARRQDPRGEVRDEGVAVIRLPLAQVVGPARVVA